MLKMNEHSKILGNIKAENQPETIAKMRKIGLYKALMNKCEQNLEE